MAYHPEDLSRECEAEYDRGGSAAVCEYVTNLVAHDPELVIEWVRCGECDAEMPMHPSYGHCLACGSYPF